MKMDDQKKLVMQVEQTMLNLDQKKRMVSLVVNKLY